MKVWLITVAVNMIIPIAIFVTGLLYLKRPAKEINWMYGYRTQSAMKSQESWDFAQKYFGKLCFRLGVGLIIFVLLFCLSPYGRKAENLKTVEIVLGNVEVIALICALLPTEFALKQI